MNVGLRVGEKASSFAIWGLSEWLARIANVLAFLRWLERNYVYLDLCIFISVVKMPEPDLSDTLLVATYTAVITFATMIIQTNTMKYLSDTTIVLIGTVVHLSATTSFTTNTKVIT